MDVGRPGTAVTMAGRAGVAGSTVDTVITTPYRVKIRISGVVWRAHPGGGRFAGAILGAVTRGTSSERAAARRA